MYNNDIGLENMNIIFKCKMYNLFWILWHCRLETNVNIDIVMESWYLNQFWFKMKIEMIRKFFLIPLKILEWGEEEHDERLQCPFLKYQWWRQEIRRLINCQLKKNTVQWRKKRNIESSRCTRKYIPWFH